MKRPRRTTGRTSRPRWPWRRSRATKRWESWRHSLTYIRTRSPEWKQLLLVRAVDVFGGTNPPADTPDLKVLHAKIGHLALENDCLEGALTKAGLLSATR